MPSDLNRMVFDRRRNGEPVERIAHEYGISLSRVDAIYERERFRVVKGYPEDLSLEEILETEEIMNEVPVRIASSLTPKLGRPPLKEDLIRVAKMRPAELRTIPNLGMKSIKGLQKVLLSRGLIGEADLDLLSDEKAEKRAKSFLEARGYKVEKEA